MFGFGKWAAAVLVAMATTGVAQAENLYGLSCGQLWYARNAIYARQGYCFKTDRAREAFGAGCFPPFGQLSGWQQNHVDAIQSVERQRGCPG
jgi:hypothetical protein